MSALGQQRLAKDRQVDESASPPRASGLGRASRGVSAGKDCALCPLSRARGQPRGRVWARRLDKQKQTWKEAAAGRRRVQESMRVLAAGTGPEQSEGQNQVGGDQPNRRRLRLGKKPTAWSEPTPSD